MQGKFRIASAIASGDTPSAVKSPMFGSSHSLPSFFTMASALLLGGIAACATGTAEGGDASQSGGTDAMIPGRADAAQGLQADAALPGTPDATPTNNTPDASVPAADADPSCTPVAVNLLSNPDFDLGPGMWSETSGGGYALITSEDDITGVDADSGTFVTWLGGYLPTTSSATDILFQDLAVPGDATPLSISGKMWVDSAELLGLAFDTLALEIVNAGSGAVLETVATWSNLDAAAGWAAFNVSPSGSYAGQTIRLRWTANFDSTKQSSFLLDTLALSTTSCP